MNRTRDGAAAYRKIGLETEAQSASPHRLVLMLFEGAQLAVANAQHHMRAGNIAEKGQSVSRAIEIIASGLQSSLDLESGGELAERLEALYEYMGQRLLHANLHNDQAALAEVLQLLSELKDAWAQIADDPSISQNSLKATNTP